MLVWITIYPAKQGVLLEHGLSAVAVRLLFCATYSLLCGVKYIYLIVSLNVVLGCFVANFFDTNLPVFALRYTKRFFVFMLILGLVL